MGEFADLMESLDGLAIATRLFILKYNDDEKLLEVGCSLL